MDLDTWVQALVDDCVRPEGRFKGLNDLYALSWTAESAMNCLREDGMTPSQVLAMHYPGVGGIRRPTSCGEVANWLCKLMLGEFNVEFDARVRADPGNNTRDYNTIKALVRDRDATRHHIIRIKSGPIGHDYVLYVPPAGSAAKYYQYQTNCAVTLPVLTLNAWIASGRSAAQDEVSEHIDNLQDIDSFIAPAKGPWILRKFTVLDPNVVQFQANGSYQDGPTARQFNFGAQARRGHEFTFAEVEPKRFKLSLLALYTFCVLNAYAQTRFQGL